MGLGVSCLAPSAAALANSLRDGDDGALVRNLECKPQLLSSRISWLRPWASTTPLHIACKRKRVEAVQEALLFLSRSPLEVVREALRPYCRRADLPLPASAPEGVQLAINMTNARGQTPLMYACYAGSPELVKLLLTHGADPWVGDRHANRTALHYAAIGGSAVCIRELMRELPPALAMRRGVRYVDAPSDCGLTGLHYSVYLGDVVAVRELLRHRPNVNAATCTDVFVTCEGSSTPLHFAAVRGNLEAAQEILQYYARRMVSDPHSMVDPRTRANDKSQLPWQVAIFHHPCHLALAVLLHPTQGIRQALGTLPAGADSAGPAGGAGLGPASLAALASAALKAKLLAEIRSVEAARRAEGEEGAATATDVGALEPVAAAAGQEAGSAAGAAPAGGQPVGEVSELREGVFAVSSEAAAAVSASGSGGGAAELVQAETLSIPDAPVVFAPSKAARNTELAMLNGMRALAGVDDDPAAAKSKAAMDTLSGNTSCGWPVSVSEAPAAAGCAGSPGGPSARRSTGPARVRFNRHSASTCSDCGSLAGEGEGEADEVLCGVCFAAPKAVAPVGCSRHGLCGGCAAKLAGAVRAKPLRCPFCRKRVAGFVPYVEMAGGTRASLKSAACRSSEPHAQQQGGGGPDSCGTAPQGRGVCNRPGGAQEDLSRCL